MREEIVRFEHITMKTDDQIVLDNLNFYMVKGETMAFLSLQNRGRDEFLRLISRNLPLDYGKVFFDGNLVNSYANSDMSLNRVSLIQEKSSLMDSLSIVDNLFVMRQGFKKFVINERILKNQASRFLKELGVSIDCTKNVSAISQQERVIIEMVRSVLSGHQLMILYYISNFLSQSELEEILALVKKFQQKEISFLYVCNHHEEAFKIADRATLFADGRIRKVLEYGELTSQQIAPYIIQFSSCKKAGVFSQTNDILRFYNVAYGHVRNLSFGVKPGECVVMIDTDNKTLFELVGLFTGRGGVEKGKIEFNGKPYGKVQASHFLDKGLVIVPSDPTHTYLFYDNNYLENLTFFLDRKMSRGIVKYRFLESVRNEYRPLVGDSIDVREIGQLDAPQLYSLVYHRIMLYHPKLAVLIQPLADGDMYCRRHIVELINSLKKMGISVFILASTISDNLMVADRLIVIRDGEVMAEYQENEFNLINK